MAPEPTARPARWAIGFDRLAAALFGTAVVAVLCRASFQNDTWWSMRVGKDLVVDHVWPWRDHFTYTVPGARFPHHEWLTSVVFYVLDATFGHVGPTLLVALCAAGALGLVWRRLPRGALRRAAIIAVAVQTTASSTAVRPHVLSIFLVVVVIELLRRERYAWLPPVFLLWANLHAGVTFGGVIVVAAIVAGARELPRLRRLVPAALLAALATLINPLGLGLLGAVTQVAGESRVSEFQPSWKVLPGGPILATVLIAWVIAVMRVRRPWTWATKVDFVAALVLLPIAARYNRNITLFVLAALPMIGAWVEQRWPSPRRKDTPTAMNTVIAAAFALAAACWVAGSWITRDPVLGWDPVPSGALQALHDCRGNLYNTYNDGGFLIWFAPERPVFIDSRYSLFPRRFVADHVRDESSGQYEATFDRWAIRCAFLPPTSSTAVNLRRDGWQVRYADGAWLVLAKPD